MSSDTHGSNCLLGRTIGDNQLMDALGDGLMGVVFLGERAEVARSDVVRTVRSVIDLPEQVVVRLLVLPWQLKNTKRKEFRKHFECEAETLQRHQRPNITSLISFGHVAYLDSSYVKY